MSGLHKQAKVKRDKTAVVMSPKVDLTKPVWDRPPPEEWGVPDDIPLDLSGADPEKDRLKVRVTNLADSWEMVEFALIQQTFHQGKWRNVVEIDSAHDTDVHRHRCGRSVDGRVGDPELIMALTCLEDVARGYDTACDDVFKNWPEYRRKWQDG